jgi:NADPH:quinone reductase-like Zn-dependent oxidoreductase
VIVSGSNPKDWKIPNIFDSTTNSGDDIAGVVEKVGANVFEFKPGDRVAAFHEMRTPAGSFAEYALAWQHTTFHIPESTTFEGSSAFLPFTPSSPPASPVIT